jgi:signal transduction histidine kinase
LVARVEAAAESLSKEGTNAFAAFDRERQQDSSGYLFVYDQEVTCVYHGESPQLVGRNLVDMKDLHGRPLGRWTQAIGRQPDPRAHDWIFYYWKDADAFAPKWKASYIRKAVLPDGRVFMVGSGLVDMKVEKAFIQERVDRAAERLRTEGRAAFAELGSPASPYDVLDNHIFVLDREGRALVDPAFPDAPGRNLATFQDITGKAVFRQALERLSTVDSVWAQYLWPRTGAVRPSRKLLYLRKVSHAGEEWVVGSSFFVATPIWMRL